MTLPADGQSSTDDAGGAPMRWARPIGVLLLVLFAAVGFGAALTKSATHDEPLHAVSGFLRLYWHDYRVDPEDPPLVSYWAALPQHRSALVIDTTDESFRAIPVAVERDWDFVNATLYPGAADSLGSEPRQARKTDPIAFINRSRVMFVVIGVALGALIWLWGWAIAGPVAALVATTLYAFDPNFLAHAPLVKSDVALALVVLGAGYAMWRLGRRGSIGWFLGAALTCAIAINVKFSGVLVIPMAGLLLLIRALLPDPWPLLGRAGQTRGARLGLVALTVVVWIPIGWGFTWASYGFRYRATRDGVPLNVAQMVDAARAGEMRAEMPDPDAPLTIGDVHRQLVRTPVKAFSWGMDHHLLPEGWLYGMLYTYATTRVRTAYLMGERRITGWWYYFPLAFLFKTPVATLIALAIGAALAGRRVAGRALRALKGRTGGASSSAFVDPWTAACLIVPPAVYAWSSMRSNLDIGLRHFLPVVPFLFLGIGVVAAAVYRARPRRTTAVALSLTALLVAESLSAYPNFIPFFNVLARNMAGDRGGFALLGDSNLDWGQDLPLLAAWQRQHTDRPLFLSYLGTADPHVYGIRYRNLPYGYTWGPPQERLGLGYIAISATNLQGFNSGNTYRSIRDDYPIPPTQHHAKLIDVLGGTIYIYLLE